MFTTIRYKITRLLLVGGVLMILIGTPIIPAANAADCANTASGTTCSG